MARSKTIWEASILRVALFPTQAVSRELDVFTQLVGEAPDSQEDRPKEGVRRQTGTLDDANLLIVTNPLRVDILAGTSLALGATPTEVSGLIAGLIPTLGPVNERLDWFSKLILNWIPRWDIPTKRVSFIGQMLAPAENHDDAYRILSEHLQSAKVTPEMNEFLYRVNWKVKTDRIPDGYYNRLTTWSAVRFNVNAGSLQATMTRLKESYFAQLEVDINTPAERNEPLPCDHLAPIFQDLFTLAIENSETGERQ